MKQGVARPERGIGFVPHSPLGCGFLTGKEETLKMSDTNEYC